MITMPVGRSWVDQAKDLKQWQLKQAEKARQVQPAEPTTRTNNQRKKP